MKKTIFLLAAFCLLLAGCGAGDTGDTPAVSVQTPAPSQGEAPDNTATAPPAGNGETTAKNFDLERGVVTLNNCSRLSNDPENTLRKVRNSVRPQGGAKRPCGLGLPKT
jgi:hypothetical protein